MAKLSSDTPTASALKSKMLTLDPAFDEGNYGCRSFRDFLGRCAHVVRAVGHSGGDITLTLTTHPVAPPDQTTPHPAHQPIGTGDMTDHDPTQAVPSVAASEVWQVVWHTDSRFVAVGSHHRWVAGLATSARQLSQLLAAWRRPDDPPGDRLVWTFPPDWCLTPVPAGEIQWQLPTPEEEIHGLAHADGAELDALEARLADLRATWRGRDLTALLAARAKKLERTDPQHSVDVSQFAHWDEPEVGNYAEGYGWVAPRAIRLTPDQHWGEFDRDEPSRQTVVPIAASLLTPLQRGSASCWPIAFCCRSATPTSSGSADILAPATAHSLRWALPAATASTPPGCWTSRGCSPARPTACPHQRSA